jgi:hypothetical protein
MQPRGIHARRSRRSADDNARSASDFIAMPILSLTHRKTVRFHPRFEIGEQSEKTFQRAAQISPDLLNFLRKFMEEGISRTIHGAPESFH